MALSRALAATGRPVSGPTPLGLPTVGARGSRAPVRPLGACHNRPGPTTGGLGGMGRGHRIRIWSKFPALLWLQKGGATPAGPLPPPPGPQAAVRNRHQAAPTGEGSRPRGLRGAGRPRPAVLPQLRARRVHEPQRRATWLPHAHQDRRHLSRTRHETSTWGFPNAR